MKTKREFLKEFVTHGDCKHIKCEDCPYSTNNNFDCKIHEGVKLSQIGAMAILRMFPEEKKPILEVGTKIKFSDKKIAVVDTYNGRDYFLMIEGSEISLDYLVGRIWEVVE